MKIDQLKFGAQFENYLKRKELRPVTRFSHEGFEVYIAEGGPYHEDNPEFPNGWYESVYLLFFMDPSTGKHVVLFRPLVFDFSHDLNLTRESRQRARVNTAILESKKHIREFNETWHGNSTPAILNG